MRATLIPLLLLIHTREDENGEAGVLFRQARVPTARRMAEKAWKKEPRAFLFTAPGDKTIN